MCKVLISDTSVLIDLERCGCGEAVFCLPCFRFAVPDLLYERELAAHAGPRFLTLGLQVVPLEPDELLCAVEYQERVKVISLPDAAALVLARTRGLTLLTGDGPLRALADAENVPFHGVLWALDLLEHHNIVSAAALFEGLCALKAHPRCRLPSGPVDERLDRWRLTVI